MTMPLATIKALRESEAHWGGLEKKGILTEEEPYSKDCACCQRFYRSDYTCVRDGETCPCRVGDGAIAAEFCCGGLWGQAAAAWAVHDDRAFRLAARTVREFIHSKIPRKRRAKP